MWYVFLADCPIHYHQCHMPSSAQSLVVKNLQHLLSLILMVQPQPVHSCILSSQLTSIYLSLFFLPLFLPAWSSLYLMPFVVARVFYFLDPYFFSSNHVTAITDKDNANLWRIGYRQGCERGGATVAGIPPVQELQEKNTNWQTCGKASCCCVQWHFCKIRHFSSQSVEWKEKKNSEDTLEYLHKGYKSIFFFLSFLSHQGSMLIPPYS